MVSFNPRTHEGCDFLCLGLTSVATMFQSTHPRGVRLTIIAKQSGFMLFQSTHPRGVRLSFRLRFFTCTTFQSTHPRGVRLLETRNHVQTKEFQSTHPRGVRPFIHVGSFVNGEVSIHAPTRGATCLIILFIKKLFVSIHAPTRGATKIYSTKNDLAESFNPRTHEGCDCIFCKIQNINIQK